VSPGVALLCVGIAVVGSTVQASIGLGFGLLATPILAMIDTGFIPGAVLVAIMPLTISVSIGSFADIDRRGAGLATAGRIPGVIAGAMVTAAVSARVLSIGLAVAVLIAVGLSVWVPAVSVTAARTIGAGAVSGFMGTTTGVGGPPMALLFQRSDPKVLRATLSAYFAVGTAMSIAALTISGDIGARQWRLGLLLVPGVVLGLLVSQPLRHHLYGPRFRPVLLVVCTASAVALLAEQL